MKHMFWELPCNRTSLHGHLAFAKSLAYFAVRLHCNSFAILLHYFCNDFYRTRLTTTLLA